MPRSVRQIDTLAFANVCGVKRLEISADAKVYKEHPEDEWWDDQAAFEECEDAESCLCKRNAMCVSRKEG